MLYRKVGEYIEKYLQSGSNKVLIVDGACQIGKSYIIRHVGQKLFQNYIEVNMEADKLGDRIFAEAKTVSDFYLALSVVAGDKMKERENTLVFIDEIQAYDHLLTLLKFLKEDDRFTYIASGSLLGGDVENHVFNSFGEYRNQAHVSDGFRGIFDSQWHGRTRHANHANAF